MWRTVLAVVGGVVVWWVLAFLGGTAMRMAWPAYAAVEASLGFDLPMMLARLALGAVVTVLAGGLAGRVAPSSRIAALILGLVLVLMFIPIHVGLWDKFPVWYHLTFLASLVPLSILGGALLRERRPPGAMMSAS